MSRTNVIGIVVAMVILADLAQGATVQTSATVQLVPPVDASLAAPVARDGATAWRIDTAEPEAWQVRLEARDGAGRLLATRQPLPGNSPTTDQDLTAFAAPVPTPRDAQVVLTLVLCRE